VNAKPSLAKNDLTTPQQAPARSTGARLKVRLPSSGHREINSQISIINTFKIILKGSLSWLPRRKQASLVDLYFIMEDLHAASAVDADADVEFLGFVHRDIEEIRSGHWTRRQWNAGARPARQARPYRVHRFGQRVTTEGRLHTAVNTPRRRAPPK